MHTMQVYLFLANSPLSLYSKLTKSNIKKYTILSTNNIQNSDYKLLGTFYYISNNILKNNFKNSDEFL